MTKLRIFTPTATLTTVVYPLYRLRNSGTLKSGKGDSKVHSFSNHDRMTNMYIKFYVFLPKCFEAT